MRALRRILRGLRSRRLAVWLIVAIAAYAAAATAVPGGDEPVPHVVRRLGFDAPFSHPVFLVLVAAMALSTAACAWERTRAALRAVRRSGRVTPADITRLESMPGIPVHSPDDILRCAEDELRSLGLKSRRGPRIVEAHSGKAGVWGSPVFHWALAALIVVVALGRLTRAEGLLGVPVGADRAERAESYVLRDAGPWYRDSSGMEVGVTDFSPAFTDERGIEVGPAPVVRLTGDGAVLGEQRVYPNRPLSRWPLLIHATEGFGLSAWVSVLTTSGVVVDSTQSISDFDTSQDTGTTPSRLVVGEGDAAVGLNMSPFAEGVERDGERYLSRELPSDPRLRVQLDGTTMEDAHELRPGEVVPLGPDFQLRFDALTYYVRLSVVDDWSVLPMYGLFLLAALALSASVFLPYRRVRVLLSGDGSVLHAEARHARRDPLFEERVQQALTRATSLRAPAPPTQSKHITPAEEEVS